MSLTEWADTYRIHHWQILWSSYRKLAWVGFDSMTTEFCSEALTDWKEEIRSKTSGNIYMKKKHEIFLQWNTNFFSSESCFSYILDLSKTAWALRILSQKSTRNFVAKEFWALEFMKEFYNGRFSVSMLKETITLVRDYVFQTRK